MPPIAARLFAAKVLAEAKQPMTARQMIEAMSEKGLRTSPGGKTPAAATRSVNALGVRNANRFCFPAAV